MPEKTIQTSIIVQFTGHEGAGAGSSAAEIESRPDRLNSGRTKFYAGDAIGYLVYLSGARITRQTATAGHILSAGGGIAAREESIAFANVATAEAQRPIGGGFSYTWKGLDGGLLIPAGGATIRAPNGPAVGLAQVAYDAPYWAYRLDGVPTTIDEVLIVIDAEATPQ